MAAERHFTNPYERLPACLPGSKAEPGEVVNSANALNLLSARDVCIPQVPADLSSRLMAEMELLVAQCDSAYRHAPTADTTVYTGTAGIALLHLHLATTLYADNSRKSRTHLEQAHSLLTPCLSRLPSRHVVTFLCGAGGPLAIAAVLEAALDRPDKARVRTLSQCLHTSYLAAFLRVTFNS